MAKGTEKIAEKSKRFQKDNLKKIKKGNEAYKSVSDAKSKENEGNRFESGNDLKNIQKSKTNELIDECKLDWEVARKKKCLKAEREKAISRIYERLKLNFVKVLRKRTGSKIVQTFFKYGNAEIKDKIFEEVYDKIPELSVCSFSIFFLQKLIPTKYFVRISETVARNYKKILTSRVGAFYFDDVYQKMNQKQKENFIKEILGNEIKIFYNDRKLKEIPNEKLNFDHLIGKILSKGLANLEIAHDLFYYHLLHFKEEDERNAFYKTLSRFFVDLLHTENGKAVACQIVESKQGEKRVVKKTGEYIANIVEDVSVYDILFRIIQESKEKYVNKYILKPIKGNMNTFLQKKNFDQFLLLLIEKNKFEKLQKRFLKEIKKNKKLHAEKFEPVLKKITESEK